MEEALIGRHPHLGFWQWESPDDLAIARQALTDVDLAGLEERLLDTLSGGERRRLAVATLLVQNPRRLAGRRADQPPRPAAPPRRHAAAVGAGRRRARRGR
jgi:ABC-type hemin transport system ATPase subunit